MFRIVQQAVQLAATFAILLRRWSFRRSRAPQLRTACLIVVLAGAVALAAICYLLALLFVALLFVKGVIP